MSSELLEEEGYAGSFALIAQVAEPVGGSLACARLTLAAGDQPVNVVEVQRGQRAEQRLG
jgi:hypothetical protein